ncbi:TetR family transcriptional regulator C-terminal domain-containing protein [Rhizobium sp. S153]|uniref:TetR family transcriptional regulator C-terminal domain-containing protein n=1 Tax=Ciceribacter sichuanensis TaxID=2949647 RepID=A0ABT0V915_9HYPH|nr:TetR family transcriptional regulator C-terminal domain-containing protein [Ciceribacter sp. S153]MCM2402289.1 TetR family transcriptional regulator C-terminal domain-containing protein [Ciceribacter sp. S153]
MSRRVFHRAGEAERRQDLIRATLDCISEKGLEGATVREIAARAGVTGGLIRHYFASKDQMLQAAYRETMASMTTTAISAAGAGGEVKSARLRLHDFIIANVSPPVTDPRTLSLWAGFIGHIRVDPEFARIHRENYLIFRDALEELISGFLAECGRTPAAGESRKLAIAINGLIDGLWLEGSLAQDLFDDHALPRIALESVEALLGGLSLTRQDAVDNEK